MPGGPDPEANMAELRSINDTPGRHRPEKQIEAIGYAQARKAGGHDDHDADDRARKAGKPGGVSTPKNPPVRDGKAREGPHVPEYHKPRRWVP